MQIQLDNDTINIIHNMGIKRIFHFVAASILLFVLIVYGVFGFIDDNQKIRILCNKKGNVCAMQVKRTFLPDQQVYVYYDKTKEAVLHKVGCHYGICTYNIRIPYDNSNIKIYSSTENKEAVNAIVENFNKYRNADINIFEVNNRDANLFVGFGSIFTIILILSLLGILFIYPLKTTIRINKKDKKLTIVKKPLLGVINKNIDFLKIGKIKLDKVYNNCFISYTDVSKRNKIFPMITIFDEKEARQIYELLSKEHKNALEFKNDNDEANKLS